LNEIEKVSKYEELFEDLELAHSSFQIHNFILGEEKGITDWGKYKQALRELHKRVRGIKQLVFQIERDKIEIEKIKRKIQKIKEEKPENYDLDIKLEEINLKEKQINLKLGEKSLQETLREAEEFYKAVTILREKFKNLSKKEKENLEKEYWMLKFKRDIEDSLLSGHKPSLGLIRTIRTLPLPMQKELMDFYGNAEVGYNIRMNKIFSLVRKSLEKKGSFLRKLLFKK